MANPLTFYVPIKQDPITQAKAQLAYDNFVASVQKGLDDSHIVHYARLALIPNPGGEGILAICLITTFDGPMNPYLKYFWNDGALQAVFTGLAEIALNPPVPPSPTWRSSFSRVPSRTCARASSSNAAA